MGKKAPRMGLQGNALQPGEQKNSDGTENSPTHLSSRGIYLAEFLRAHHFNSAGGTLKAIWDESRRITPVFPQLAGSRHSLFIPSKMFPLALPTSRILASND
jgi:hypothetical protein